MVIVFSKLWATNAPSRKQYTTTLKTQNITKSLFQIIIKQKINITINRKAKTNKKIEAWYKTEIN